MSDTPAVVAAVAELMADWVGGMGDLVAISHWSSKNGHWHVSLCSNWPMVMRCYVRFDDDGIMVVHALYTRDIPLFELVDPECLLRLERWVRRVLADYEIHSPPDEHYQ